MIPGATTNNWPRKWKREEKKRELIYWNSVTFVFLCFTHIIIINPHDNLEAYFYPYFVDKKTKN